MVQASGTRSAVCKEDIPFQFRADYESGYKVIRPTDLKDEPYIWQA